MSVAILLLFVCFSAVSIGWAVGKLTQPIGQKKLVDAAGIDLLMSGPIAAYTFPPKGPSEVSEEQMGESSVDMRIEVARQGQKIEGLTNTVEREFARMAEALGKHADAVNNAFAAMKSDYVTRSDFAALTERANKVERIVYGACGVILLAVLGALVALVVVKP